MTGAGFAGVRQPEFDTLTGKHTQAAGRLEQLAQSLYGELQGAGLDTAPALRIRELAGRVGKQAADLRRRQTLIRELERERISFETSRPEGSFMEMPDGLDAAQGLLDGSLAAGAALLVAGGDTTALARLQKYARRGKDPEFARVFLANLGAKGLTQLPGTLAAQLNKARDRGDTARLEHLSTRGRQALRLLGDALAQGTDPKSPAYAGDGFLKQLAAMGRADHTAGDLRYAGYQAQALLWRANDGKPPLSARFMEVVGGDAIAYEKEKHEDRWAASKAMGARQVPLLDLATTLSLGTLLRQGTAAKPDKQIRSGVVEDLFQAAGSDKESSQALLAHTPPGWKQSVLTHLLTTRLGASRYIGDLAPFRNILLSATAGQDAVSTKLAAEMTKVLADEVRGGFGRADNGNLTITDPDALKRIGFLRYPLARAMAANIDQLSHVLLNRGTFGKADATDMSYALAFATRDDAGFEALLRAQTEHMKAALDSMPPVGLDASNLNAFGFTSAELKHFDFDQDGRVGKADVKQFLVDNIVAEARPFSHMVEIRRQALIAEGLDGKKASDAVQSMVRDAVGLIPFPGVKQVGTLAEGAFGSLITSQYDKLSGAAYDQVSKRVAQLVSAEALSLDEAYQTLGDDRVGVNRLAEQMIATAMLNKGLLDEVDLKGQIFATGTPPRIKPFTEMSPAEYGRFLTWVRENGGSNDLLDRFNGTFRITSEVDDHLNLRIPSSPAGGR